MVKVFRNSTITAEYWRDRGGRDIALLDADVREDYTRCFIATIELLLVATNDRRREL